MQKCIFTCNINTLNYFFMDADYRTTIIIENNKKYKFDFIIKNNKLNLYLGPQEMHQLNAISKLIIGNKLYFDIENDGYYNANISKTNYETIKRYNKVIFEINANDIINIIKDIKLYNDGYYLYIIKKSQKIYLFTYNNKYIFAYKFIDNKLIFDKKYLYYDKFLVDDNDNLFCIYDYKILPVSRQFKYYDYFTELIKYKLVNKYLYNIIEFSSKYSVNKYLDYSAYKNNNEIVFILNSMRYGLGEYNFDYISLVFNLSKNNKFEIISYRKLKELPFVI